MKWFIRMLRRRKMLTVYVNIISRSEIESLNACGHFQQNFNNATFIKIIFYSVLSCLAQNLWYKPFGQNNIRYQ